MTPDTFCSIARRLMQHPAAPYHEQAVRAEAESICAEHNLVSRRDAFGNLLVHLRHSTARRPLVLAAHLDHPGFEILKPLSRRVWLARFRGGVPDLYFRPGTPLLLMPGRLRATLGRRRHKTERIFEVEAPAPAPVAARFAV